MTQKGTASTCGDHGGTTFDGSPCPRLAGDGRGAVKGGKCVDCYTTGVDGERPGRKKIMFTDEQIKQIERMAAVLTKGEIAYCLGVSHDTLGRRMREDPRIEMAYNKGRAEAKLAMGASLIKHARNGSVAAAMFYLRTQGGWRATHTDDRMQLAMAEQERIVVYVPDNDRGQISSGQKQLPPGEAAETGS